MIPAVSTPDILPFYKTFQQLFPVELTLLLCVILLIASLLGLLYHNYRKKRQARTTLMVELFDVKEKFTWKIQNLPLNRGNYRFIVDQQASCIKLN